MFSKIYKIFILFLCYTCGAQSAGHNNTIQKILARKTLRVGMIQGDRIPYAFHRDGQLQGIDVKLARKIAKHLGVKLKLVRTAKRYNDVVDQVQSGAVDMGISNLSISLDRALKICYSKPYIHLNKAVLIQQAYFAKHKKDDQVSLVDFFSGKNKLGVLKGTAYVEFARQAFPKATLVLYEVWEDLITDVRNGKIAGAFWDQFEVEKIIFTEHHGLLTYMVVHLNMPADKVAIALPKDDTHLWHWINTFMDIEIKPMTGRQLAMRYLKDKEINDADY